MTLTGMEMGLGARASPHPEEKRCNQLLIAFQTRYIYNEIAQRIEGL